jgi:hypothetical protein
MWDQLIYDNFIKLVDDLTILNKINRVLISGDIKLSMGPDLFNLEFCTVHVNAGRRIGKTEYIINKATSDSLIVVCNEMMRHNVMERMRQLNKRCDIMTAGSFDQLMNPRGYKIPQPLYKTIYIDEPRLVFRNIPETNLYQLTTNPEIDQTYVLLGT